LLETSSIIKTGVPLFKNLKRENFEGKAEQFNSRIKFHLYCVLFNSICLRVHNPPHTQTYESVNDKIKSDFEEQSVQKKCAKNNKFAEIQIVI